MIKEISEMTDDELRDYLRKIRLSRKARSSNTKKKTTTNPFADLDPEIAQKVLDELQGRKGEGGFE